MTSTVVRRLLAVSSLVALLVVGSAAAASADTPVSYDRSGSWEPKPDVDVLQAFLLLGGIPLLILVVITLLFVAPALARGENLRPNALEPENQWLGGPRKEAGELAAPDSEDSQAGGAGGSW